MARSSKTKISSKMHKKWTEEATRSATEAVGDISDDYKAILSIREAAK